MRKSTPRKPLGRIVGARLPAFEGLTPDGRVVHVDSLLGRKLWICLYRDEKSPGCIAHLEEIRRRARDLFMLGIDVLAVFETHLSQVATKVPDVSGSPARILVLADPERAIRAHFETSQDEALPLHLLVSEDGFVQIAHFGQGPEDHLPWSSVEIFGHQPAPANIGKQRMRAIGGLRQAPREIIPPLPGQDGEKSEVTAPHEWNIRPRRK